MRTATPEIDAFQPIALSDLLPYGIGCEGIDDAAGLAHPKVFVDPQSGTPHIFATDFSNCVFQILKIDYEVVEEWVGEIKRRAPHRAARSRLHDRHQPGDHPLHPPRSRSATVSTW